MIELALLSSSKSSMGFLLQTQTLKIKLHGKCLRMENSTLILCLDALIGPQPILGMTRSAWMALLNGLKTKDVLASRNIITNTSCPLCISSLESSIHLFAQCPYSTSIWARILSKFSIVSPQVGSFEEALNNLFSNCDQVGKEIPPWPSSVFQPSRGQFGKRETTAYCVTKLNLRSTL